MSTRIVTGAQNAACDAIVDLVDAGAAAGTIKIYTGTQPASANDGIGTSTLLATFTLADPAFGAAASGSATLAGTPLTTTGDTDGTAGWFRCADSAGATVFDGAVATSGAELNLNTTSISTGVTVEITSGTFTMPAG
ncbi:hypothetical protein GCM10012275_28300 [Longimycelium tulufanense]|uniref:Uncharacterized protein n=1 Tax=Longimycelium tulufanense TaxID=907463 RepID=A0A8J3CEP1_9PSEU|nr:hypothetical protein [Longimycelium tulufanense]GGM55519.1 hypothetical protein GCM10012275_28300 [Longimycelium tulufanense]